MKHNRLPVCPVCQKNDAVGVYVVAQTGETTFSCTSCRNCFSVAGVFFMINRASKNYAHAC